MPNFDAIIPGIGQAGRRTGQGNAHHLGQRTMGAAPKRVLCGLLYGLGRLAIIAMIISMGLFHRRIGGLGTGPSPLQRNVLSEQELVWWVYSSTIW